MKASSDTTPRGIDRDVSPYSISERYALKYYAAPLSCIEQQPCCKYVRQSDMISSSVQALR